MAGKAIGLEDVASGLWKAKTLDPTGSPADCSNYRPIRLRSHTMKIFDNRIRDIVEIIVNKAGFVTKYGTIDAINAARLLIEKHCHLYIVFLDLLDWMELIL